jgi:uracil-DNA glycosylase
MVAALVAALSAAPTAPDAYNEYAAPDANNALRRANLTRYLTALQAVRPTVMLVMEAPGYRGCRLTGIPVTSRKILREHGFFGAEYARPTDAGFEQIDGEQSATIVWQTLDALNVLPLIWNTFPFHPHQAGNPLSNRAPRRAEIEQGQTFLQQVYVLFAPTTVIAVGKVAAGALTTLSIAHAAVRHPAQGGKNDFVAGLQRLLGT